MSQKYQTEALSIYKVVVDSTAGGRLLSEMAVDLELDPRAHRISLQAVNGDIYVSQPDGLATVASFVLLNKGATTLDTTLLQVKRLRFYAEALTYMNVLQQGDE